jgi:alanine-glyoxylate transaminase/serine-glyoxylate transaminase/serine-pyruvate transaminase
MKEVWHCPEGQPFIVAGTGTLAMDMAGSNLIEPGDNALVISTGYFGDRYADLLKRYGAQVDILKAPLGETVSVDLVENALKSKKYKLLTFTHVDTSTAILNDPVPFGKLGQKYGVLTILDGVCSVAGEEILQQECLVELHMFLMKKMILNPR